MFLKRKSLTYKKNACRYMLAGTWLIALFICVVAFFWHEDWVYSRPTPVPDNYKPVNIGSFIQIGRKPEGQLEKPVLLHFFNPDCACSRFNIEHVKDLIRLYGKRIDVKLVLVSSKPYTGDYIRKRFGIDVPVVADDSLSVRCGVYSTPQAVLVDQEHRLFYRGNYNQSRYCVNRNSNYAKIAIEDVLAHRCRSAFNIKATTAYGCQLPGCKQ